MHPRLPIAVAAFAVLVVVPALGATRHAATSATAKAAVAGPKELGHFGDWTAATYDSGGQTICYAFTRAKPASPTSTNTAPLLMITERPSSRDEVAITAPVAYPKDASVLLQVGQTGLDFYTSGRDAFARDGKAAVSAMRRGDQAITHGRSTDTYSLQGFTPAYDAITKSCPAR